MTDAPANLGSKFKEGGRPKGKKASPFSLRLTFEERARLESEAGELPLGAYVRSKVLGEKGAPRKRRRRPVKDDAALGRLLALLGRAKLANNLNQLAHAANSGSLLVTGETEKALREACAEVAYMRRELLRALGQRSSLET
jgi:hypothetical protein